MGGVDTVLIQRKVAGGNVINATEIRNHFLNDDMDSVKDKLPVFTYRYLVSNSTYLKKRYECMERLYQLKGDSFGKITNSENINDFVLRSYQCCICGNEEGINILLKDNKIEDYSRLIIVKMEEFFTMKTIDEYSERLSFIISDTKNGYSWFRNLRHKGIAVSRIMIANFD